ncbi:hypothetical protein LDENG_00230700 [Lucifuga dentata]|nr:hypothetical protein LDENG_00230700 [Lucifuga dentata]
MREVIKALKNLNTRKPAGPDNLEPVFLKLASDFIGKTLCRIFNFTLSTNKIPKAWKAAFVIPLLKGSDPSILNNYRPISKLPVLAKLLETLVCDQVIKEYLATNSILSTFQSGFHKNHSTTTAAVKVINDIIKALDKRQCCLSLFIDLSKAFDTVDHNILIGRLLASGFSVDAVGWFRNDLTDRTQTIQLEGTTSEVLLVQKGVPQGSVLGPLLFTLYINSLGQNIPNTAFHFYADDTVIYSFAPTPAKALQYLQFAFDRVQEQLNHLQLVLNADKTKLMFFTNSGAARSTLSAQIVTMNGNQIELVSTFKYLGFLIDDQLSFKEHIHYVAKKN